MKKLFLLFAAFLVLSGCSRYSINSQKSGIFNMVEMDGNLIPSDAGILGAGCTFDFTKRYLGKDTFYGIRMVHSYSGSGFDVDKFKGARIVVNGTEGFFVKYRKRHSYNVVTTTSGGGSWMSTGMGGGMMYVGGPAVTTTTTTITIHGLISKAQLLSLIKAESLQLELIGPSAENETPARRAFIFNEQNIANLKRFYDEYVAEQQGGKI